MSEYKPSFKAWLFSIFLAAGFGNAAADGITYLIKNGLQKDGRLVVIDKGCWGREIRTRVQGGIQTKVIPSCEYIFVNKGDRTVLVTDLKIDNIVRRSFHTNNPAGFREPGANFTRANVAVTAPGDVLVIQSEVDSTMWNSTVCLYNKNTELTCVTK